MKPALSQICTLNATFAQDVEDYASAHCPAIELWLTKLEQYVASHSLEAARELLARHQLAAPVASFQGGLLTSQGEPRRAAWDLFTRRLRLCAELGVSTLVLHADLETPLQPSDLDRATLSLRQAAEQAGASGLRLALEFQARAAFANNLQTAVAVVEEVGSPHLGLCLDAFQFYVGPSKTEDLPLLSAANLFHVQLCDLADVPREFARDADRILPGEGDIPLGPLIQRLQQCQYSGYVSVELMNPQIWQVPSLNFAEIGITALRRLLDQARME